MSTAADELLVIGIMWPILFFAMWYGVIKELRLICKAISSTTKERE